MLTAVQFNDQFASGGTEVCDVITNGMLVPKVDIPHAVRPQMCPESGFSRRHFTVQLLCPSKDPGSGAFMQMDPLPASPNWKSQLGEEQYYPGWVLQIS